VEDWNRFHVKLKSQIGFTSESKICYYYRNKSYNCNDKSKFIRIFNGGTQEFEMVEQVYSSIEFTAVSEELQLMEASSRGNVQACYGFSCLNITEREEESHYVIPCLNKGTTEHIGAMIQMSRILHSLGIGLDKGVDKFNVSDERMERFAKKIHPENILEGITLAMTRINNTTDGEGSQYVKCHVDKFNSCKDGYNYLCVVSKIMEIGDCVKRIALIAYGRKSVDDYYNRVKRLQPVLCKIDEHYHSLTREQVVYDHNVITNSRCSFIIEGGIVVRDAHIDIRCFLSPFVYSLLKIKKKFWLTFEQMIELIYVCGLVTDPFHFSTIITDWCRNGILPSGNLAVELIKDSYMVFGGMACGPVPRHQIKFTRDLKLHDMFIGMRIIRDMVIECNSCPTPETKKDVIAMHTNCILNLNRIHNFGTLASQRVLNLLLLTGIIKTSKLAEYAEINKGTNTYRKLQSLYQLTNVQMSNLLDILSFKYRVDRVVAENLVCETLRNRKAYDYQFPKQSLYQVTRNEYDDVTIEEITFRGDRLRVAEFNFPAFIIKQNCINWWRPSSVFGIKRIVRQQQVKPTSNKEHKKALKPTKIKCVRVPRRLQFHLFKYQKKMNVLRNNNIIHNKASSNKVSSKSSINHILKSVIRTNISEIKGSSINRMTGELDWKGNLKSIFPIYIDVVKQLIDLSIDNEKYKIVYHSVKLLNYVTVCTGNRDISMFIADSNRQNASEGIYCSIEVATKSFEPGIENSMITNVSQYLGLRSDPMLNIQQVHHVFVSKSAAKKFTIMNYFFKNDTVSKVIMEKRKLFVLRYSMHNRTYTTICDGQTSDPLFRFWRKTNTTIMISWYSTTTRTSNVWKLFCKIRV